MTDRARIADELNAKHAAGRSWRDIARDYPGVTFQMLNKIALTGKLPRDRKILRALGLTAKRPEEFPGQGRVRRKIAKLAKETREALKR